jgi:hypothetical protein
MDAQSIRAAAMATPKKVQDIATPFWPGTDGQIVIADQNMDDIMALQPLASTDPSAYGSAMIVRSLVSKETGEPAFSDADRDWIKTQGSVVLTLMPLINAFLGLKAKDAVAAEKNV